MSRPEQIEVLVVGAGPVGIFTALLLARQGISVRIIDEESGPAAQSYACGLHPGTLRLFRETGLEREVLQLGRRIETFAFYEGESRRGEIDFSRLPLEFPFVLVLPQQQLEELLMTKLREAGVEIRWDHRLSSLCSENSSVLATVDQLGGTTTGYIVPRWETVVKRTRRLRTAFLIGADGHNSLVRRLLSIDQELLGEPELYVIYEFASETAPDEVRVIYDKGLLNVLWPLPEGRCRWSFQWPQADEDEFPHKDRRAVWFEDRIIAERTSEHLQQLIRDRVPWFAGSDPTQVEWAADAQFARCLAARFGQGRCWLAGDAAHQTGPVGMQSMNVGLREGALLAGLMKRILRDGESTGLLETYSRERRDEWRQLLGATGRLQSAEQAASHLDYPSARLLSCIPGSEGDLSAMMHPLGFEFPAV